MSKNRNYHIRLSDAEYNYLLTLRTNHGSISKVIRKAIAQFNDQMAREKFSRMIDLSSYYSKFDASFAKVGSNLNQAMHHLNSLALNGSLDRDITLEIISERVKELEQLIRDMRNDLYNEVAPIVRNIKGK